jgi:hypothetical protein
MENNAGTNVKDFILTSKKELDKWFRGESSL